MEPLLNKLRDINLLELYLNCQQTGAESASDVVVNVVTPVGAPTTNPSEQKEHFVKECYITTSQHRLLTSLFNQPD
jgi:hypothetical protein